MQDAAVCSDAVHISESEGEEGGRCLLRMQREPKKKREDKDEMRSSVLISLMPLRIRQLKGGRGGREGGREGGTDRHRKGGRKGTYPSG